MKRLLTAALLIALAAVVSPASADPTTVTVVTTPKGADVDIGEPCVVAITLHCPRVHAD